MNGCAPGLALIERLKATRKWAIKDPVKVICALWHRGIQVTLPTQSIGSGFPFRRP